MTNPRGWVLRLMALGVALAVSLSGSEALAQTKTRVVNRSRFVNLVTSPLQTPTTPTLTNLATGASSLVRQTAATSSALPNNATVLPQLVTFRTPVGFGGNSGFVPAANPTPFADPNPSPSE